MQKRFIDVYHGVEKMRNADFIIYCIIDLKTVEDFRGRYIGDRYKIDRSEADRSEADRSEADRSEADRSEADRSEADR